MRLRRLQWIVKLKLIQYQASKQVDEPTNRPDDASRVNFNIARGSCHRWYPSDDAWTDSFNIVDAASLLLCSPCTINQRLYEQHSYDTSWDWDKLVNHGVKSNFHKSMCLLQVHIVRLSIYLVVLVKDASDQNRQRKCAEEDKQDTTCDKYCRIRLPQVLTFLHEQVSVVFYLLNSKMAQIWILLTKSADVLLWQLVNFL